MTVLAVEDEPHGLDELCYLLRGNDLVGTVFPALDAGEALSVVKRSLEDAGHPRIDAVFTGINMPVLDGIEMVTVIQAALVPTPAVVFVTGHAEAATKAFDLGASDYVLKPYSPNRIRRAVEKAAISVYLVTTPDDRSDQLVRVGRDGRYYNILRSSVTYLDLAGATPKIYSREAMFDTNFPASVLVDRWEDDPLLRINGTTLVNPHMVDGLVIVEGTHVIRFDTGDGPVEHIVEQKYVAAIRENLVKSARAR